MLTFRKREATTEAILHATHTPPSQSNLEAFLAVKGRTMGLLEIGYHYLILQDGKLVGCRPDDTIGAHCKGANRTSIGIALAGGVAESFQDAEGYEVIDLAVDNFTEAQMATLCLLMDFLYLRWPGLPLVKHSDKRMGHPHECPPINTERLRAWFGTSLRSPSPASSSPPAAPTR